MLKALVTTILFSNASFAIQGKYLDSKTIPNGVCYIYFGYFKDAVLSGVIINDQWLLTAGHAIDNGEPSEIHCKGESVITDIAKVVVHPGYYLVTTKKQPSAENPLHDLMLIKIQGRFRNKTKLPILKDEAIALNLVERSRCQIYGAGGSDIWNDGTHRLRAALAPSKHEYYSTDKAISLTGSNGGQRGDSGGPLLCKGDDNQNYLVGALSYISLSYKYRSYYNFLPHPDNWQWIERVIGH